MSNPWDAEHPVDRALAEALIAEQFPALAGPVRRLGQGWDNDMWCSQDVGGPIAWRFPRRQLGVELIGVEASVLPALARTLPLPIPNPTWLGAPSPAFPYPFLGYRLLTGTTGDRARLTDAERLVVAPMLGDFLKTLHAADVEQARTSGIPEDTFRGDMAHSTRVLHRFLPALADTPWSTHIPAIDAAIADAPPTDPAAAPVLMHGDLYARHVLIGEDRRLCGVIDWGDVCVGDPCKDLTVMFSLLPPSARGAFRDAYGPIDAATERRARYGALKYGVALLAYGLDVHDEPLTAEGAVALNNALR